MITFFWFLLYDHFTCSQNPNLLVLILYQLFSLNTSIYRGRQWWCNLKTTDNARNYLIYNARNYDTVFSY